MPKQKGKLPQLKMLPLSSLVKNSWNPNQMSKAAFERLKTEIADVGFAEAITVIPLDDGKYLIVGGEHRFQAVYELGWTHIPAVILTGKKWANQDLQKLVTVRLNVIKGKLNPTRMAQLYTEMAHKYGEDALKDLFAFTDEHAWASVLKGVRKGLAQAGLDKGALAQFDVEAKEAKSVEDLGKIINSLFHRYGDTVAQSFMVFTFGGKKHLYVQCSEEMWKGLSKITRYCKDHRVDINEIIGPAVEDAHKKIVSKKPAKKSKKDVEEKRSSGIVVDDSPF